MNETPNPDPTQVRILDLPLDVQSLDGHSWRVQHHLVETTDAKGRRGFGEAVPEAVPALASRVRPTLEAWAADETSRLRELSWAGFAPGAGEDPAARAALSISFLDLQGQREAAPLARLLNMPAGETLLSAPVDGRASRNVGPIIQGLVEAGWTHFDLLLDATRARETVGPLVDRFPDATFHVDLEGTATPLTAGPLMQDLALLNVASVEQPLPASMVEESAALMANATLPIILDESVPHVEAALRALEAGAGSAARISLARCGGPFEARRKVKLLRSAGWGVILSTGVGSRLGLAAAATFAGAVDRATLDGLAPQAGDPFSGFDPTPGRLTTPDTRGVGVQYTRSTSGQPPKR